jgi:hypothetical protein
MKRAVLLQLVLATVAAAAIFVVSHDPLDALSLGPQRPPPPRFDCESPSMRAILNAPLATGFRVRGRRDECYEVLARETGVDIRPAWISMRLPPTLDALRHDELDVDLGGLQLREALLRLAAPGPKANEREKPGLIVNGTTITVTTARAAEQDLEDRDPSLRIGTRVYVVTDFAPPPWEPPAERRARLAELFAVLDTDAHVFTPRTASPTASPGASANWAAS